METKVQYEFVDHPADLSATPNDNQLGIYLRQLWDAARAAGQTHGVWRPDLGRFVTLDELREMEAHR